MGRVWWGLSCETGWGGWCAGENLRFHVWGGGDGVGVGIWFFLVFLDCWVFGVTHALLEDTLGTIGAVFRFLSYFLISGVFRRSCRFRRYPVQDTLSTITPAATKSKIILSLILYTTLHDDSAP